MTTTWDLTSYFPEFNGPEMLQFKEALRHDIASLRDKAALLPILTDASLAAWEEVLARGEDLTRRMSHLSSYISCLASSDARNEDYLKEEAALALLRAEFAKVRIEYLRAFKGATDAVFAQFLARPYLAGAENYLTRVARRSAPRHDRGEGDPRHRPRRGRHSILGAALRSRIGEA